MIVQEWFVNTQSESESESQSGCTDVLCEVHQLLSVLRTNCTVN